MTGRGDKLCLPALALLNGADSTPGEPEAEYRQQKRSRQRQQDEDGSEVMLYYGVLGDYPQWVSAYSTTGLDVRRYPISITIGEGAEVIIDYSPEAFMTAEDVGAYCTSVMLPAFLVQAQAQIDAHNTDPQAHPAIKADFNAMDARMSLMELRYNTEVSGNPFTATFEDLSKLRIEGVWNAAQKRVEF